MNFMITMKKDKKRSAEHKVHRILIFLIVIIVLIGILIFKKPATTGKVILSKETIYSDNLNIKTNESSTYIWQIKNPGNIKSLKATGFVTSNGTARVYVEKNSTKYLLFDSAKQLLDVNIHVLPDYKNVVQGNEILIQITLLNLRGFGAGDVNVKYFIKDSKGNLIATQEEKIFVETQAKFIRKLLIPPEIKPGGYVTFVEASTNSTIIGTGSDTFEVKGKYEYKYPLELKNLAILLAFAVGFVIAFIWAIYGIRRLKKKKEIIEIKEKMPMERIEKLEKELKALEDAYKSGFISEESFKKEKKRIEDKLGVEKK